MKNMLFPEFERTVIQYGWRSTQPILCIMTRDLAIFRPCGWMFCISPVGGVRLKRYDPMFRLAPVVTFNFHQFKTIAFLRKRDLPPYNPPF